jgi:hypothetical protein
VSTINTSKLSRTDHQQNHRGVSHEYCQILLIGERLEQGVEPTTKDQKHDKETPKEELEKLEHEDELRVEHLHGMVMPTWGIHLR